MITGGRYSTRYSHLGFNSLLPLAFSSCGSSRLLLRLWLLRATSRHAGKARRTLRANNHWLQRVTSLLRAPPPVGVVAVGAFRQDRICSPKRAGEESSSAPSETKRKNMNTTENLTPYQFGPAPVQPVNQLVKPLKFPSQPQEWKIVSLRECPTPLDLQVCDTSEQAAAYWRTHITPHPWLFCRLLNNTEFTGRRPKQAASLLCAAPPPTKRSAGGWLRFIPLINQLIMHQPQHRAEGIAAGRSRRIRGRRLGASQRCDAGIPGGSSIIEGNAVRRNGSSDSAAGQSLRWQCYHGCGPRRRKECVFRESRRWPLHGPHGRRLLARSEDRGRRVRRPRHPLKLPLVSEGRSTRRVQDFDAVLDSVKAAGLAREVARLKARFAIKDSDTSLKGAA